jgi:hypothetical protein
MVVHEKYSQHVPNHDSCKMGGSENALRHGINMKHLVLVDLPPYWNNFGECTKSLKT